MFFIMMRCIGKGWIAPHRISESHSLNVEFLSVRSDYHASLGMNEIVCRIFLSRNGKSCRRSQHNRCEKSAVNFNRKLRSLFFFHSFLSTPFRSLCYTFILQCLNSPVKRVFVNYHNNKLDISFKSG